MHNYSGWISSSYYHQSVLLFTGNQTGMSVGLYPPHHTSSVWEWWQQGPDEPTEHCATCRIYRASAHGEKAPKFPEPRELRAKFIDHLCILFFITLCTSLKNSNFPEIHSLASNKFVLWTMVFAAVTSALTSAVPLSYSIKMLVTLMAQDALAWDKNPFIKCTQSLSREGIMA